MSSIKPDQKNGKQTKYNLMIAVLVGQVGILTLLIVLAAVFGGLAFDARFGTKPWITIGLLILSIPVSTVLMIFIAKKTVKKLKTSAGRESGQEDVIGKDS